MPTIVVLVKTVPDTWSTKTLRDDARLDRESVDVIVDEINEFSVEQALRIREDAGKQGTQHTTKKPCGKPSRWVPTMPCT